ncbi:MAG: hypothetical protein KatS3mg065_0963 [Chloroflexota bacterium]|nr:MAG: hypothetical protein KatS3mg065_0963 [Chloroflexota bacterium]
MSRGGSDGAEGIARSARIRGLANPVEDDLEGELHRPRVGDPEETLDRPRVGHPPLLEIEDAVGGEGEGFFDPVLDDDDGTSLVGQSAEDGDEAIGRGRVEVRQRLVEDEDVGLHHEDAGHGDELPLAPREGRRFAPDEVLDGRPACHRAQAAPDLGRREAKVLGAEGELRLDRRPDDLAGRVLEDGSDGPGDVAEPEFRRRTTPDAHRTVELARVGVGDEPVEGPDEGALAAARGSGDEGDRPRLDGQ